MNTTIKMAVLGRLDILSPNPPNMLPIESLSFQDVTIVHSLHPLEEDFFEDAWFYTKNAFGKIRHGFKLLL
jgi:hypothetical protein